MRWINKIFFLVILLSLAGIVYVNRALYTSRFEPSYWKNRYDHSQWKLPGFPRTLGDDGLYLYEGYRLIKGDDPTLYNAEVPPFGKYLIGASIMLFGNGYIFGFVMSTCVIAVFYLLAKSLIPNKILAVGITAIFTLDPLLVNQFALTMLDSTLVLFLLLYLLCMLYAVKSNGRRQWVYATAAGIALGLFSEVKVAVLTPVLLGIGVIMLGREKAIRAIILLCGATLVAYILPYIWYFYLGHTALDWLGVQKWIIQFYLQSHLAANYGSAITTLLLNQYQNLFTHTWTHASQWSISWPVITVLGIFSFLKALHHRRKQDVVWFPLAGCSLFFLIFFSITPFWTRYLLLLLPLLYIGAMAIITKWPPRFQIFVISVVLIVNVYASFMILFPTPEPLFHEVAYDWQHGFFQDLYEQTTAETKTRTDRAHFHKFGLQTFYDGEIEEVTIAPDQIQWSRFISPQVVSLTAVYKTRHLGSFRMKRSINLIKEHGRWTIDWRWSNLFDGFDEHSHLETKITEARRGTIMQNNLPVAYDFDSYIVWETPTLIDKNKEEEMNKYLEVLFMRKIGAAAIHERVVGNSLGNLPVPIGVIPQTLERATLQKLKNTQGITLTPHLVRSYNKHPSLDTGVVGNTLYQECCSYLYTTTSYDGISGIEKEKNDILKGINGGTLTVRDNKGKIIRTLIQSTKKDGRDVIIK